MSSLRDQYDAIFGRGRMTERVVFFSDAVFAIAMTLLVVDLRVPDIDSGETSGEVIVSLLSGFLAYGISFAVIAINWNSHHRKFRVINGFDSRLIQLNFLLLFLVAFTPFPTSLMSEYAGEVPSVVLYAAVVASLSLVQYAMWAYAWRHDLVDKIIEPDMYRYVRRNVLVSPVVFGISILIAIFWDANIAMYSWLALIPLTIIVARVGSGAKKAQRPS